MSETPIIEVTDLVRKFGSRTVLKGISFKVFKGDTMIIMGGSGCGKSTLLRHINGAMKPTSGSIKIFGEEITTMSERDIARIRRRFRHAFPERRPPAIDDCRRKCGAACHGARQTRR